MKRFFIIILSACILFPGCSLNKDLPAGKNTDETTEVVTPGSHLPPGLTPEESPGDVSESSNETVTEKSQLTGLPYSGNYNPVLVIIENSPAARPQSGLIDAEIVYEVMVEARYTRFLAVFNDKEIKKAGPVRSLRHYYLDLVREWNTVLVHYGASRFARDEYNSDTSIHRIDGMVRDKPFWRDSSRKAPHNAYVNVEDCRKEIRTTPNALNYKFNSDYKHEGTGYKTITMHYNQYTVSKYVYDSNSGMHLRYINDKPHTDRESGKQIEVKNIIVHYAPHTSLKTKEGHIDVDFVGTGKAEYFIDGIRFTGTWKKDSPKSRTVYYDNNGKEITLQPGNTWIQVLSDSKDLKVDNR